MKSLGNNINLEDGIICCCKLNRNELHNESMKFKIEFQNEERDKNLSLFRREKGSLETYDNERE